MFYACSIQLKKVALSIQLCDVKEAKCKLSTSIQNTISLSLYKLAKELKMQK
jgi:hypothetical protein